MLILILSLDITRTFLKLTLDTIENLKFTLGIMELMIKSEKKVLDVFKGFFVNYTKYYGKT